MLDEGLVFGAALLGQAAAQVGFGALDGLIEQVLKAHGVPGARLELLAVVALHQTEGHMLDAHCRGHPTRPARHLKHPGKVGRLTRVGHIDEPPGAVAVGRRRQAVADRRQIGGGVIKTTVALLHEQRQGLAVLAAHPLEKHTTGAVVDHQQARSLEVIHDALEVGVVERLAALPQANVEAVIDALELAPALLAQQSPGLARQRLAALQLDHLLTGGGLKRLVFVKAGLGLAVEGHQITQVDRVSRVQGLGRHLLEVGDQHAELGTPVAHMVEPQHGMAAELQHPRQAVADDRRAQMPDVHLLGDVGAGKIHDHRSRIFNRRHPQACIAQPLGHFGRQALGPQGQVDEAWAGDHRLHAQRTEGRIRDQLLHDRAGDLARRLA